MPAAVLNLAITACQPLCSSRSMVATLHNAIAGFGSQDTKSRPIADMLPLIDPRDPLHDTELLRHLRGRRLSADLNVLCVIGAHRLDELPLIDRVFPHLRHIYLFEPLPEPAKALRALATRDPRIKVFEAAISDCDGTAPFHVTSNDGESSSLLSFGTHGALFPDVHVQRTIEIPTRTLDSVLAEYGLEPPDLLIVDVQGAEFTVLSAMGPALLSRARLLYTEVSTEPVYQSAGLLPDVERLLSPHMVMLGFAPLRPTVPMHGNAVFAARADAADAVALTATGAVYQAWRRWRRQRRRRREARAAGR